MADSEAKVQEDIRVLREQFEQMQKDLGALTGTLGRLADDAGDEARERLRGAAEEMRAEARQAQAAVSSEIEQRPFTSVLVALVVGLMLGALFSSRR